MSPEFPSSPINEHSLLYNLPTSRIQAIAEQCVSKKMLQKLHEIVVDRASVSEYAVEVEEVALYIVAKLAVYEQEELSSLRRIQQETKIEFEMNVMETHFDDPQDPRIAIDEDARIALFKQQ